MNDNGSIGSNIHPDFVPVIDLSKLPDPPQEKSFSELDRSDTRDTVDDSVKICRFTASSLGTELQIRPSYQMIYVVNGECALDLHGARAVAKEGDILVVARGVPHVIRMDGDSAAVCAFMSPSLLKKRFSRVVELQSPLAAFISNSLWGDVSCPYMHFHKQNRYVEFLFGMLVNEECYPSAVCETIKDSVMMTLFGVLSTYAPSDYGASSIRLVHSDQIPKILIFISDNYRTVTLDSLAKHFHYTVPYVSKLIRCATGMTFTSILSEIKFDVCRSLLLNSDLKIYQIAEVAGFQNTDHFNRIFKKRTGVTPSDYKKIKPGSGIDNDE